MSEKQENNCNNSKNGDKRLRWKNRRRMAWTSLISMIVITLLLFFAVPESRLTILSDVITWYYFIMGGIITAYMGFTTISSIKGQGKIQ
jgi:uncharacterized integral membrane protein